MIILIIFIHFNFEILSINGIQILSVAPGWTVDSYITKFFAVKYLAKVLVALLIKLKSGLFDD